MSEHRAPAALRLGRADRQPPRRHRAAARALRDGPPRLPRDRSGPAPDRAATTSRQDTLDFLEPHVAFFTFGENYGRPGCGLPVSDRFPFHPTRQPVVTRLLARGRRGLRALHDRRQLASALARRRRSTASATAGARTRSSASSSHLPSLDGPRFELALSSYDAAGPRAAREPRLACAARARLLDRPRRLPRLHPRLRAREFTVAKDQNVRLRTRLVQRPQRDLSRRRPPRRHPGHGLRRRASRRARRCSRSRRSTRPRRRSRSIEADYAKARQAAFELAREHFDADVVLGRLLDDARRDRSRPASRRPARRFRRRSISLLSRGGRRRLAAPRRSRRCSRGRCPIRAATRLGPRRHDASVVVVAPDGLVFTRLCLESVLLDAGRLRSRADRRRQRLDATERASTSLRSPSATRASACSGTTRTAASARPSTRASRRPTATCSSCSTTTRSSRRAGSSRLVAHLERPEVGLVGPTTNRCGNEAEVDAPYRTYGEMVAARGETGGRARGSRVRHRGRDALLRRDAPRRLRARRHRSTSASRSGSSRTTTTPRACARRATASSAPRTPSSTTSARRRSASSYATGRYGELFRANKAPLRGEVGRHLAAASAPPERLVSRPGRADPRGRRSRAAARRDRAGRLERRRRAAPAGRASSRLALPADGGRHLRRPPPRRQRRGDRPSSKRCAQQGAEYILFPETALWWLEFYDEFLSFLRRNYDETGSARRRA